MDGKLFKCKCLTNEGDIVHELVEATDIQEVQKILKARYMKLISYEKESFVHSTFKKVKERPLSSSELVFLCDQFYFIFSSGTNLMDGLLLVDHSGRKRKVNHLFKEITKDVAEGVSLSSSLKRNQHMLPDILIYMVETGESSGNLEEIFLEMKEYFLRQQEIKRKVTGALVQPAFLMVFGLITLVYFLKSLLPELMENLDIKESQLPLLTKVVLGASSIVTNHAFLLLFGFVITVLGGWGLIQRPSTRLFIHRAMTKVPFLGRLVVYLETFKVSIALSLFLKSNVPIVYALDIIAKLMSNEVARKSVKETKTTILEGMNLSDGFERERFFDESFIRYIGMGEATGNLEEVTKNLTQQYRLRIDDFIKKSLTILEPAMTVVMTLIVGVLVMSIVLPIFSMVDYIQ